MKPKQYLIEARDLAALEAFSENLLSIHKPTNEQLKHIGRYLDVIVRWCRSNELNQSSSECD